MPHCSKPNSPTKSIDVDNKIDLAELLSNHQNGTEFYACGPEGMIAAIFAQAAAHDVPATAVHREIFQHTVSQQGNRAFTVKLNRQNKEFHIPAEQSVLDVLLDNGIDIDCSCEQGVCGTCITRVLQGEIDHRDAFLSDTEKHSQNVFMPCCSRAKSPILVLDL